MDEDLGSVTDQMLLEAIRKRLLEEISAERQQAQIINQIYGGSPAGAGAGGVMGSLGNASGMDPGQFDYYVDIARTDRFDPDTGEKIGWDKNVHRYRQPKKKAQ